MGSGPGSGSGSGSWSIFFLKECCFRVGGYVRVRVRLGLFLVRVRVSINSNPDPKTAFFNKKIDPDPCLMEVQRTVARNPMHG